MKKFETAKRSVDTIKRCIAIARRKQAEIEELNPDYVIERDADAKIWYEREMDLIELEAELEGANHGTH
jgi:hypothetical protein